MRNQAYVLAAFAAVVIGCGGGSHHSSNSGSTTTTGTTPGTTTTGSAASGFTVGFPATAAAYGRVEVEYLTGQGRANGDTYLEVTRQSIQNGDGVDVYNNSAELGRLELNLAGFQTLSTGIDIPLTTGSQLLNQFVFDPNRVLVENAAATLVEVPNGLPIAGTTVTDSAGDMLTFTQAQSVPANIDARIRAFPGRISVLQVRVSAASFHTLPGYSNSSGSPAYVFDLQQFTDLNDSTTGTDPTGQNLLASRLSDFIRFDLSHVTDKPALRVSYDPTVATQSAGYLYFSGDNIALSTALSGGAFTELEPTSSTSTDSLGNTTETQDVVIGSWRSKPGAGTASFLGDFLGTYSLTDANPVDVAGVPRRLVSLYGSFRDYTEVLSGGSTFEMIMLPNSGEQYDANRPGDIVALVRNGSGQITSMFYGGVDLTNAGASTTAGRFYLLPIRFLGLSPTDAGIDAATLTGSVTGYVNANGTAVTTASPTGISSIRKFKFTFDSGKTPSGGTATGTVTVLRV